MKILHTSDLHLNSKMNTRLGTAEAKERKRELLESFAELVSYAKHERCTAFIIAGDLFDTDKIGERVKQSALDIIRSAPELNFFYLTGNHEKAALKDGNVPENMYLFSDKWTYYTIGGVAFAGRESTEPDMFAKLEMPEGTDILIAILHGELRDRSERGGIIGARELSESPVNYLALGHYHSFTEKEISRDCHAVYCGTPAGRGFDEAGDKGFVIIETEGKNVKYSFQKANTRKFIIADVSLDGIESKPELDEKISHACREIDKNSLVRIRLTGHRAPEFSYDTESIRHRLASSFYYIEIKDESRLLIRPEDYKFDKTLKGEFIRTVYADMSLDEDEKEEIIKTGIKALMGERFDEV